MKSEEMTLMSPQMEVKGWRTPLIGKPLSQSMKSTTCRINILLKTG